MLSPIQDLKLVSSPVLYLERTSRASGKTQSSYLDNADHHGRERCGCR